MKTTACFDENDVSFYGKRRVVLWKTTCRFMESDGSFLMHDGKDKKLEEKRNSKTEFAEKWKYI